MNSATTSTSAGWDSPIPSIPGDSTNEQPSCTTVAETLHYVASSGVLSPGGVTGSTGRKCDSTASKSAGDAPMDFVFFLQRSGTISQLSVTGSANISYFSRMLSIIGVSFRR